MAEEQMNDDLRQALSWVESINSKFESVCEGVTGSVPEYELLIWGSTIQDTERTPNDLDIIFSYSGDRLPEPQIESIKGWMKSEIDEIEIDPVLLHKDELPQKISNSRVSKVYNVMREDWMSF